MSGIRRTFGFIKNISTSGLSGAAGRQFGLSQAFSGLLKGGGLKGGAPRSVDSRSYKTLTDSRNFSPPTLGTSRNYSAPPIQQQKPQPSISQARPSQPTTMLPGLNGSRKLPPLSPPQVSGAKPRAPVTGQPGKEVSNARYMPDTKQQAFSQLTPNRGGFSSSHLDSTFHTSLSEARNGNTTRLEKLLNTPEQAATLTSVQKDAAHQQLQLSREAKPTPPDARFMPGSEHSGAGSLMPNRGGFTSSSPNSAYNAAMSKAKNGDTAPLEKFVQMPERFATSSPAQQQEAKNVLRQAYDAKLQKIPTTSTEKPDGDYEKWDAAFEENLSKQQSLGLLSDGPMPKSPFEKSAG